ncbi:MAG: mechanosensitive ion channel family protein [Rhizobiales bacterium]|nr:mechanosensitive ion channel family protein [Hyphomicrobiales bacterium]
MWPRALRPSGTLVLLFLALVVLVLFEGLLAQPLAFLTGLPIAEIKRAEIAALVFVAALILARAIRRDLVHGILEARAGKALPHLLGDILWLLVVLAATVLILMFVYGRDVTAIIATGGLGLAVLGIALRDVILAVFNGAALSAENTFTVGDRVKIGEVEGTVVQTNWRSTTILTPARRLVSVPNANLGAALITNFDRPDRSEQRILEICLDYDVSAESAERLLLAGVLGATGISLIDTPRVHAVRLDRDGIVYAARYVIADNRQALAADHAVIKSVLARLRDASIGVSYPKQEVVNAERRVRVADRRLDRKLLVQQYTLFQALPAEVQEVIADKLIELHIPVGADIVRTGDRRNSLFIVGEGLIIRKRARAEAIAFAEERFVATQAFGQRALFASLPHPGQTYAATASLVFELTQATLLEILAAYPEIKLPLADALAAPPSVRIDEGLEVVARRRASRRTSAFYLGQLEALTAD